MAGSESGSGGERQPSAHVQRKREGVRRRILETAQRLIAEGGVEALTIQAVADSLDYTPGALYRYVSSRDEMLVGAQRVSLDALAADLAAARSAFAAREDVEAEPAAVGALGEILVLARHYAGLLDDAPEDIALISVALGPRTLVEGREAFDLVPTLYGVFGEVVQAFQRADVEGALEPGDATRRAVLYWSTLQGVLQLDKLARLEAQLFDARGLARELAPTLLRGWGADAEVLARARELVEDVGAP